MDMPVYIYGATGYGKTKLVEEYLNNQEAIWFQSQFEDWDLLDMEVRIAKRKESGDFTDQKMAIVIDNIQFLSQTERKELVLSLAQREDIWLVLIGRTPTPQWLIPLLASGQLLILKEELLHIKEEDLLSFVKKEKLKIPKEDISNIIELCCGNAYMISITIQFMLSGEKYDEILEKKMRNLFDDHLENQVISQWSMEVQDFLMKVSVVDRFPLELAVMITGDDRAAELIGEAQKIGNFIYEENEIYYIRPQLLRALNKKALKVYGLHEYNRFISNAGHYYEIHDDALNALKMYEACSDMSSIRSLLIRNGRRHFGVGNYYELRRYYLDLPDKEVEKSPVLMSALCMLYSVLLNVEKSEYWYQKLKDYTIGLHASEKREADELLLYLDFSIPHRGSIDMIDTVARAASLMKSGGIKLPELSVTSNVPSAMNGGKDFCNWSKKDQFLADTIGGSLERILGSWGRGLVNAGLCESFYEKGGRDSEVVHLAMLVQMAVEGGGRLEVLFIAFGIQIRLNLLTGKRNNALDLLNAFEERMIREKNETLKTNFDALKCRVSLVLGQKEYVESWMKDAPNEIIDFCILERYRYMTKALCYLSMGENLSAIFVLDKLISYARSYQRPYILMESLILIAIAFRRENQEWKPSFLEGISLAQEYKFVRVISEKGAGVLPLLKGIKDEYSNGKKADVSWFRTVLNETISVSERYPNYLSSDIVQPSDFTEIAMSILKLQAEGFRIKEISETLDISERTVKYHAAENYRKLNAKGKTDAVQIARSMNLI